MKDKIHPQYGPATIACACGNKIKTASTVKEMEVEVCSACHPAFTGKAKLLDAAGRVDKFKARQEKAAEMKAVKKVKKKVKAKAKTKVKVKTKTKNKKITAKPKKTQKKKTRKKTIKK